MSGIDTINTTSDPDTLWKSDKRRKRHIQKHLEGRRKPSSAEGTRRALEGYHSIVIFTIYSMYWHLSTCFSGRKSKHWRSSYYEIGTPNGQPTTI